MSERNRSRIPSRSIGISWRGARLVDGIGGELEELLGRKGVVPDVEGRRASERSSSDALRDARPARAIRMASLRSSVWAACSAPSPQR